MFILVLMIMVRVVLLLLDAFPFNSDEAIVGLMALHINFGELPIFFYGQAYMGSLDAFLVALGFLIFGNHIITIRIIQTILFTATFILIYKICRENYDDPKVAYLAAILLAIPSVNILLYTTVSLGGYGEALFLGNLSVLLSLRIKRRKINNPFWYFVIGFIFGLGLWANALTVVYSIPCGLFLIIDLIQDKNKKSLSYRFFLLVAGILVGSLPWWIYASQVGIFPLIRELTGSAVSVETQGFFGKIFQHGINFLVFGTTVLAGLRPPWDFQFSLPLLAPIIGGFWVLVYFDSVRAIFQKSQNDSLGKLYLGVFITFLIGFLFTSFGVDPSGRYFLPLAIFQVIPAAVFLRRKIQKPYLIGIVLVAILINGVIGIKNALDKPAQGITTQFYTATVIDHRYDDALIEFLEVHGETRGYTNYWVAYPIIFRSSERVILSPALPYHLDLRYTNRDDRYKIYTEMVNLSDRTVYITTNNKLLDEKITAKFVNSGITWEETQIGDYHVFYGLSRPIRPGELEIN